MLTIEKNDIISLLTSFKNSLEKDGFTSNNLDLIDTAIEKINNNYPIRTEINIVYQNFLTLNLVEKKALSIESKNILNQLKELATAGSVWSKINDLMTTNTWLGR